MVLGGSECAQSAPDGYTLCVVSPDTMSFNPLTVPNLAYDPEKDFAPVIDMYNVIEGLMVPADLHVGAIEELRAKAAAEPAKLNFGTLGERTTTDAFRQWLGEHWHTTFVAIPYKGGSEIIAALLGNTIDVTKIGVGNMTGQLQEGKIRVLALRAAQSLAGAGGDPDLRRSGLRRVPRRPDLLGHRRSRRHAGADRRSPARRIVGHLPWREVHRLRRAELSRTGRRLDRGLCRFPAQGSPRRRDPGRQVYEVTPRRGVIPVAAKRRTRNR